MPFAIRQAVMQEDEKLIDLFKTYPYLYYTKITDSKINLKKENAWKAILIALVRPGESCACLLISMCYIFNLLYSGGCAVEVESAEG